MLVTESVPSFTASLAMCECGSMMPGMTNLPVASITVAPAGAAMFLPTCAILPPESSTSVLASVPRVTVITVAFLIRIGAATTECVACACRAGPRSALAAASTKDVRRIERASNSWGLRMGELTVATPG